MSTRRILGIDPGLRTTGFGVIESEGARLAYVASGRLDAYVERRISLWDFAAGGLMVEAAGGEFHTLVVKGQYRYAMVADNGKLRKKLAVDNLLP